jgi:hypothetical protein
MIAIDDLTRQVTRSLGAFAEDYSIDEIVAEIHRRYGLVDIDAIEMDDEAYWELVEKFDISAGPLSS